MDWEFFGDNSFYALVILIDLEGSVLRDPCFPDIGLHGVAFDIAVANILVDLRIDPGALPLWCPTTTKLALNSPMSGLGIWVRGADKWALS